VAVLVTAARLSARRREGVAFVMDISRYKATERRLTAELATADALAHVCDRPQALSAALQVLCEHAGWSSASLWMADAHGVTSQAAHGRSRLPVDVAARLVARALAGDDPGWNVWTGSGVVSLGPTVALVIEDVAGLGTFTDREPDPERLVITRAVAGRIKKWIEKANG
jgi:hypothetical protein